MLGQVKALRSRCWVWKPGGDNLIQPGCTGAKDKSAGRRRGREAQEAYLTFTNHCDVISAAPSSVLMEQPGSLLGPSSICGMWTPGWEQELRNPLLEECKACKNRFRGWKLRVLRILLCLKSELEVQNMEGASQLVTENFHWDLRGNRLEHSC